MATITIDGFIHASHDHINDCAKFWFFGCDMTASGYALIKPHTIEAEVPDDFNLSAGLLASLQRKRAAALDEAARAEREIAQLGAIGKTG